MNSTPTIGMYLLAALSLGLGVTTALLYLQFRDARATLNERNLGMQELRALFHVGMVCVIAAAVGGEFTVNPSSDTVYDYILVNQRSDEKRVMTVMFEWHRDRLRKMSVYHSGTRWESPTVASSEVLDALSRGISLLTAKRTV